MVGEQRNHLKQLHHTGTPARRPLACLSQQLGTCWARTVLVLVLVLVVNDHDTKATRQTRLLITSPRLQTWAEPEETEQ